MAQCINLFTNKEGISFPCSKCLPCLKNRASQWSFRLMEHYKICSMATFLTLTYDSFNVPLTPAGFMSLNKGPQSDLSQFFKRLRFAVSGSSKSTIKYFAVGEYGGKTQRPHYHVLLFNCPLDKIQPCWPLGQIHYGTVTIASVGYCLKYICKKGFIPQHKNDDRQPEFAVMSKGLGANYLTDKMRVWHAADLTQRMYVNVSGGQKVSMPRYIKDKLYTPSERELIKSVQQALMIEKQMEQYDTKGYDNVVQHKKILQKADIDKRKYVQKFQSNSKI